MSVVSLAARHHGVCTWTFSQAITTSPSTWLKYREFAWKGICAALSSQWIRYHANDGSLANILGGGNMGDLNVAFLRKFAAQHQQASTGHGDQEMKLLGWLEKYGIIPCNSSQAYPVRKVDDIVTTPINARRSQQTYTAQTSTRRDQAKSETSIDVAAGIIHALQSQPGKSFYAYVTFGGTCMGTQAGHVVAVFIGQPSYSSAGDAMMFDPNYGEYWFERKQDFFDFFPPFYQREYRSGVMSFNKRWSVQPLAKAMAFAR